VRISARLSAYSLIFGLAAGCGSGESTDNPATPTMPGGNILRIAYEREIDVLNAYTSQMLVDISFSMVEGLITTNGTRKTDSDRRKRPRHAQRKWHDRHDLAVA
jgi:hypothetical protein